MPHLWNNKVAVTKDELAPWYKADALTKTIQRYKKQPYGIKRLCNGHNGQPMLVDFDTLPPHIREVLPDPRKCDHILERFFKVDGDAVRFYSTEFTFEDGTYLDREYQERYVFNASVLRAIVLLRQARETERLTKGGSLTGIGATLCSDAHSFQKILHLKHKVQHTLPENYRRFMQTLSEFEKTGYRSLISGNHKNQKARKVTDDTLSLIKSMFARDKTKPTATEVHRRYDSFINGYIEVINLDTSELFDPSNFKKLSDSTVKAYLAKWESKIATYSLRSADRQKLMQQFKPYHSLDKPKFAGSIISIDDRNPPFKSLEDGKRIWFYNGIDLASEAFTCWVHGATKDDIIKDFYRQMLRNYFEWGFNLPLELEAEMSLNSSFVNTFLREGAMFKYVRIEANNARGKRIERYYGNLRYGAEKQRTGWLARPHAQSEANQPFIEIEKVPLVPRVDIVRGCLKDIEDWNNTPHSVHEDMTRWEVFCKMQHPETLPTNYLAILPHIGYRTETSCRTGIIRLQGKEFLLGQQGKISLGGNLIELMKQTEGQQIQVYWLDDNDGKIFKALVFDGTQYICEAIAKPTYQKARAEQTEQDHVNRSVMSAYVATIESFGRRQKQQIDRVILVDNTPALKKTFTIRDISTKTVENTGRVLPDQDEDEFINQAPTQSFVRPLKDRF
ncbi:MAG: hypothetical protein ACXVAY_01585 [Mucilaginibacter sp.]